MLGYLAPLVFGAVAVAVMLGAPSVIGDGASLDAASLGILLGVLVLLAGLLVQEMITRQVQVRSLRRRLDAVVEQTLRLREDVRRLRDGSQAQATSNAADASEMETVVAEMRMLKTLVQQISTSGPGGTSARAPAHAPAPQRPAAQPPPAASGIAPHRPPSAAPTAPTDYPPEPSFAPTGYAGDDTRTDEQVILDVIREALAEERLELAIQPIVTLPSRRLGLWECLATIRTPEGIEVPQETYMEIAEKAGLQATINNMLLVRSVQFVRRMRRQKATIGYVCPIVGETLRDRAFFADFLGFMQENRDLAGLLSFSITQQDVFRFDNRTDTDVVALSKLGFRFVLDQVSNLDLFVSDLSAKGFRLVKVPAHLLLAKHGKVTDPRALKRTLDRGAIDLMVTGVNEEAQLVDLLDFAVDYGQGTIFGGPRPADRKPDIIDPR